MHPLPANYGRTSQQLWPPSILCIMLMFLTLSSYSDIIWHANLEHYLLFSRALDNLYKSWHNPCGG
jgi:hypothetical protein